jgi:hypothetical protein
MEFLLFSERLNYVEFKRRKQNLIQNLINFFVGCAHSLQIYAIVIRNFCFCHFLIPLRHNIIWILQQLLIQNFYSLCFSRDSRGLWCSEKLRADAILCGIKLKIREKLF